MLELSVVLGIFPSTLSHLNEIVGLIGFFNLSKSLIKLFLKSISLLFKAQTSPCLVYSILSINEYP